MRLFDWLRGFVSIHFHAPVQINLLGRRPPRAIPAGNPEPSQRRVRQRMQIDLLDFPRNRASIQMGSYLLGQPASDTWRDINRELEARYRRRP
jgi:hypothetical protein